jgi:hypothetical protein
MSFLIKKKYKTKKKKHYFLVKKNKRKVVVVDWAATPFKGFGHKCGRGGLCATLGHFQNIA